jgi:hypothetical protein
MGLISLEIFSRHDNDLAGESMAESVEGRFLFAGVGFGAGGVLGICPINFGAVGFGAVWYRHWLTSLVHSIGGRGERVDGNGR